MSEQRTFAGLVWDRKGKVTRREQFLAEMDAVIPWTRLRAVLEPYYPKYESGRGRKPMGLEQMLRIYFVQQWFDLSDPAAEDAIYDSKSVFAEVRSFPEDKRLLLKASAIVDAPIIHAPS